MFYVYQQFYVYTVRDLFGGSIIGCYNNNNNRAESDDVNQEAASGSSTKWPKLDISTLKA